MFKSSNNTSSISRIGIVAALYIAITLTVYPIAYGPIQLRLSEILVLLTYINPLYGYAVSLGVFISNLFSHYGIIDAIVGTSSTLLAVILISKTKNLFIATIWPTITVALFVGPMLHILIEELPILAAIIGVAIGQFIVLTCIGYPVFKIILNNKTLYSILKF